MSLRPLPSAGNSESKYWGDLPDPDPLLFIHRQDNTMPFVARIPNLERLDEGSDGELSRAELELCKKFQSIEKPPKQKISKAKLPRVSHPPFRFIADEYEPIEAFILPENPPFVSIPMPDIQLQEETGPNVDPSTDDDHCTEIGMGLATGFGESWIYELIARAKEKRPLGVLEKILRADHNKTDEKESMWALKVKLEPVVGSVRPRFYRFRRQVS